MLSTPEPPRGTARLRKKVPCIRRSGNRTVPAPIRLPLRSIQLVYSSTKQGAYCVAAFVPAQQPGTVGWLHNPSDQQAQRQQAGAEFVVTRCRVSGNQLLVLHPKEVLRNHGFLSAFFVSFVARQKTPARRRNILSPQTQLTQITAKMGGDFCFIYTSGSGPPPIRHSGCYMGSPHALSPNAN